MKKRQKTVMKKTARPRAMKPAGRKVDSAPPIPPRLIRVKINLDEDDVSLEADPTPEQSQGEAAPAGEELEALELEKETRREATETSNAYTLYLREIGQTKLLTPEEEVKLAKRIHRGDERAREQMIRANLRLVVKIARDYEEYGLPLLDLINEGNMGLMKAVERFDPNKGAKLSTYAAWWIKQAIRRALANQSKTIRLPVHVGDKILHMRRAAMKLQEVLGRDPTDEELAEELGTTPFRISELRSAAIRPASLDAPIGDDDSDHYGDIVQDEKAETPYEELEGKTNTAMVRELVRNLPDREATILRYRFGLDGDKERTLEEVGQKFGVTRERIRQIQNIALKKLRKVIEKREAIRVAA
jgi:RNA polymerase primary sigma factor